MAAREALDEPRRRYVMDLCAGKGSLLEVVQRKGLHYVPVDIDISAFAEHVAQSRANDEEFRVEDNACSEVEDRPTYAGGDPCNINEQQQHQAVVSN